jgi:membrane protein
MWLVGIVRGLAERLIAAQIVTNSLVLAAQTFLALFPLIILVYALIPPGAASGLVKVLRTKVGITGNSGDAVLALFQDRSSLQQGLSLASGLLVLGSATAFTRALQRVYEGSWGVPKLGLRGVWRWVAWLAALGFYLSVVGALIHLIGIHEFDLALQIGLAFLFWWWSPFLLLGGRVCWRALIPGAVITTVSQVAVTLGSTVVMPRLFRSNEADYGPIGVVFALETWLVVVAGVLVVGAALGALVGQSGGRFGHWLVGNDRSEGWRRQPRWGRAAAAAAEAEARGGN